MKFIFNRCAILFVLVIVITSLFNLSIMPAVSISVGILSGLGISIFGLKFVSWKHFIIDLLVILICSQIGWAALLV